MISIRFLLKHRRFFDQKSTKIWVKTESEKKDKKTRKNEPVSAWEREARCTSGASNHGEECQNDSSVSKHVPARARGEMNVPACSRASLSR